MWPDDDDTPEPAAWINFNAATSERNVSFVCESELASIPLWPEPPRAQRKPLTDDQIAEICMDCSLVTPSDIYFARAIEKAHGIK
jgi:hypothetical protein